MTYLAFFTLFVAWGLTVYALHCERQERMALYTRTVKAETAISAVRTVVTRSLQQVQPGIIDEKIAPMVEEAKALEITGHQKRMQVILRYLKEHPGASVDSVEQSIERVLLNGR
jgi:hypothetical protein